MGIGSLTPLWAETCGLGAHDNGGTGGHGGVVIETGVLQLCGKYLDMAFLEEPDALLTAACHAWHGEDGSYAASDEVRVVEVGEGVADDDSIDLGGISASEHSPEIAWFLHALEHHHERVLWKLHVVQAFTDGTHLCHHTFGATPIGYLLIKRRGDGKDAHAVRDMAEELLLLVGCEHIRTQEEGICLIASINAMHEFTLTFNDEEAFLASC